MRRIRLPALVAPVASSPGFGTPVRPRWARPLVAGLVMGALLLATVPSVAAHDGDGGRPPRPADTYVAARDAFGTQAFSAAAAHGIHVRYLPTPWCLAPDRDDTAGRCGHR